MNGRPTLLDAVRRETPLILPLAHDALSARLIERAGFHAFAIGGSAMLASRYALPDLGIAALGEMVAGARDVAAASRLPFVMDGDDGYGDVKSVRQLMRLYAELGVGGVVLEDQGRSGKQPGDSRSKGVVPTEELEGKIRAARAAREGAEPLIIARSDARPIEGLDAAMRRCERYLAAGAEGVFIPGLRDAAEIERVGAAFRGVQLMLALVDGGGTPWLPPAELGRMGFTMISYPGATMLRAVAAIVDGLAELREAARGGAMKPFDRHAAARAAMDGALDLAAWREFEGKFAGT
ncbi:MAG: isocitrate lyase/PEP mutase family protein [Alphaproteobacteria bacterium]|nr:isocitrate lyase/PEP mutase family protein [Alphaproteobacteria bacterium]